MNPSNDAELLRELSRVCRRTRADGRRVYAEDQVRSLLFVLYLRMSSEARAHLAGDPAVAELIGELAIRIGFFPGDDPAAIGRAIERWYAAHPVDPALRAEVEHVLREHASGAYARASIGAFSKLLGDAPRATASAPAIGRPRRRSAASV